MCKKNLHIMWNDNFAQCVYFFCTFCVNFFTQIANFYLHNIVQLKKIKNRKKNAKKVERAVKDRVLMIK